MRVITRFALLPFHLTLTPSLPASTPPAASLVVVPEFDSLPLLFIAN